MDKILNAHNKIIGIVNRLNDEEAGILFKHILGIEVHKLEKIKTKSSPEKIIKLPKMEHQYVDKFIDIQAKDHHQVQFWLERDGREEYMRKQYLEADRLIQDGYDQESIKKMLRFILVDGFWKHNILTISKLNKKNKDGVPYSTVIRDKIMERGIGDLETRVSENYPTEFYKQIVAFVKNRRSNGQDVNEAIIHNYVNDSGLFSSR